MKKLICTILGCSLFFVAASAQNLETGFFLDNYSYGSRINPAYQSDANYIGIIFSDVQAEVSTNAGMGSLLFSRDGRIVTGLNKAVSSEDFLSALKTQNSLNENLFLNLVSVGFWGKSHKSFHTIEFNGRQYARCNVPAAFFSLLKKGGEGMFDIKGTSVEATMYSEFVYGYSRKIGEKLTVGARAKFLIGMMDADMSSTVFDINSSADKLLINSDNRLRLAQPAIGFGKDADGNYDINSLQLNGIPGVAGLGGALDLGVSYKPIEDLTLSLAVCDLGGISWNYSLTGEANVDVNTGAISLKDNEALQKLTKKIFSFKPTEAQKEFDMLPFSVNAGARYVMPFYKGLSAGLFGTFSNYKTNKYFNARLGVTLSPVRWFSLTGNYGYGTYGHNFGAAFSLTAGVLNIFVGYENGIGKMMADVPVLIDPSRNYVNFGINFRFGGIKDQK